ncbi:hypothetical protein EMCRGX_G002695 [Ephydatia muelleri]
MSHRSGDSITPCPSSTPKLQDYANLEMVNPDLASDMGSSQFTMSSPCASMSVSNPLLARIWCTVADMFLKAGKTSDALSCVREAQFLAPHFPSVLLSYGGGVLESGTRGLVANCYRIALDLELTAPLQPFSVVLSSLVPSSL